MSTPHCKKCDLVLGADAVKNCAVISCPQKGIVPRQDTNPQVVAPSEQLARSGVNSFTDLKQFLGSVMAEVLSGDLDNDRARTVSIFSRQLIDVLNQKK